MASGNSSQRRVLLSTSVNRNVGARVGSGWLAGIITGPEVVDGTRIER
jgi:hypothetical protein